MRLKCMAKLLSCMRVLMEIQIQLGVEPFQSIIQSLSCMTGFVFFRCLRTISVFGGLDHKQKQNKKLQMINTNRK